MRSILILDKNESEYIVTVIRGSKTETVTALSLQEIKSLYERTRPTKTVLLLDPSQTILEVRTLPIQKESELTAAIEFTMEEALPYPPDMYHFIYKILKKSKDSSSVLLCAVLKETLEKEIQPLTALGIEINEIRCTVAEVLQWCKDNISQSEYIAVLKVKDAYVLTMFSENAPVYIKVSKNKNYLHLELERIKKQNPLSIYWAADYPLPEAKDFSFNIEHLYQQLSKKGRLSLVYSLSDSKEKILQKAFYIVIILAAVIHLSSAIISYFHTSSRLASLQQKTRIIKRNSIEILNEIRLTEDKARFLREVYKLVVEGTKPIISLQQISKVLPKNVEIERITIRTPKVQLVGFAPDTLKVVKALSSTGYFRNISSVTSASQKEGLERFIIKMEIQE